MILIPLFFFAFTEPCIRVELVEQIPHISNFLVNHVKCPPDIVPQSILPILEQFLTDGNNQVQKKFFDFIFSIEFNSKLIRHLISGP